MRGPPRCEGQAVRGRRGVGGGVGGGVGARRTDGVVVMAELRQLAALLLAHHRRDVVVGVGAIDDAREHGEGALLGLLLLHEADALGAAADALARVEHLVRARARVRVRVGVRVRVRARVRARVRV